MSNKNKLPPIHPGRILKEEFMVPLKLSANQLALKLHVPTGRITTIINGERAITSETALRLAKFYGNTAEFWINLQSQYDLQMTEDAVLDEIEQQVLPLSAWSQKS